MDFQLISSLLQISTSIGLSALVSTGVVLLLRTYLTEKVRSSIKSEYDQQLETHKAQLKAQSDLEVEKLRSVLSISAAQRQYQFESLHAKRAEIIAENYKLLKSLVRAAQAYTSAVEMAEMPSRVERHNAAADAYNAFHLHFDDNAIYFPKETRAQLVLVDKRLKDSIIKFSVFVDRPGSSEPGKWFDIEEDLQNLVEAAIATLDVNLQHLLGHDD